MRFEPRLFQRGDFLRKLALAAHEFGNALAVATFVQRRIGKFGLHAGAFGFERGEAFLGARDFVPERGDTRTLLGAIAACIAPVSPAFGVDDAAAAGVPRSTSFA